MLDVAERKRCWALPGWGWGFLPPASPSKNAPDLRQEMCLHTRVQMSCSLADGAAFDLHLGLTLGLHRHDWERDEEEEEEEEEGEGSTEPWQARAAHHASKTRADFRHSIPSGTISRGGASRAALLSHPLLNYHPVKPACSCPPARGSSGRWFPLTTAHSEPSHVRLKQGTTLFPDLLRADKASDA